MIKIESGRRRKERREGGKWKEDRQNTQTQIIIRKNKCEREKG